MTRLVDLVQALWNLIPEWVPDWLIQGVVVVVLCGITWNILKRKFTWKVLKQIIVWTLIVCVGTVLAILVLLVVMLWLLLTRLMGLVGREEWLKNLTKPDKSDE